MKYILVSDLHVGIGATDFIDWSHYASETDILVVAGDTTNSAEDTARVLNKIARKFRHVIATDGNHENYANANQKRSIDDTVRLLAELTDDNITMLSHFNPRTEIDGMTFFGCNGWYSLDAACPVEEGRSRWLNGLNDNAWIDMMGLNDGMYPDTFAARDAWIMDDVISRWRSETEDSKKAIVVTHTPPLREAILWKPEVPGWNFINGCFVNLGMGRVLEKHAAVISNWNYGHTHTRFDFDHRGVRLTCNPRGYAREAVGWTPVIVDTEEVLLY